MSFCVPLYEYNVKWIIKKVREKKMDFRTFEVDYPLFRWIDRHTEPLLFIYFSVLGFPSLFTCIDCAFTQWYLLKNKRAFSTMTKEIRVYHTIHTYEQTLLHMYKFHWTIENFVVVVLFLVLDIIKQWYKAETMLWLLTSCLFYPT